MHLKLGLVLALDDRKGESWDYAWGADVSLAHGAIYYPQMIRNSAAKLCQVVTVGEFGFWSDGKLIFVKVFFNKYNL